MQTFLNNLSSWGTWGTSLLHEMKLILHFPELLHVLHDKESGITALYGDK